MYTPRIAIINYSLGNLSSVGNALASLGVSYVIADTPEVLEGATHLILPGVGSFRDGMTGLSRGGWREALRTQVLEKKKPFLGICLGMQLLADTGFENGEYKGLSFIAGQVEKIPITGSTLPLPHIGWNSVRLMEGRRLTKGLPPEPDFYFVHSYRFVPKDAQVIAGVAEYGVPIPAIIEKENIFGTQFHPEKSAEAGLIILKNFSEIASLC